MADFNIDLLTNDTNNLAAELQIDFDHTICVHICSVQQLANRIESHNIQQLS